MTIYSPSNFVSVVVPAADDGRGCGQPHVRDVSPDQAWGLTCSAGCEDWLLAHDDRWVKDMQDIKPTFDEEKAVKRLELTGAKDQAALMTAALAQIAGFSQAQLPPSVQRMITGIKPHVPLAGQMECPSGHGQPAGQPFCGQCGARMSAPAQPASITTGTPA